MQRNGDAVQYLFAFAFAPWSLEARSYPFHSFPRRTPLATATGSLSIGMLSHVPAVLTRR